MAVTFHKRIAPAHEIAPCAVGGVAPAIKLGVVVRLSIGAQFTRKKVQPNQPAEQFDVRDRRHAHLVVLAVLERDLEPAPLYLHILDAVPGVRLAIHVQALLVVDGHRTKGQVLAGPVALGQRWLEQREHSPLDGVELVDTLQAVVQDDLFAAVFRQGVLMLRIGGGSYAAVIAIVRLDAGHLLPAPGMDVLAAGAVGEAFAIAHQHARHRRSDIERQPDARGLRVNAGGRPQAGHRLKFCRYRHRPLRPWPTPGPLEGFRGRLDLLVALVAPNFTLDLLVPGLIALRLFVRGSDIRRHGLDTVVDKALEVDWRTHRVLLVFTSPDRLIIS